jgi:gamma-glutamylcyclotransferase (GGCT)/AIG2-like uncharacterized protein YtfP
LKAKIFVYGTLRRSEFNHHILQRLNTRFVCTGHVKGTVTHKYPAPGVPTLEHGEEQVTGEVFEVPETAFPALDCFEYGYKRVPTAILTPQGNMKAWVYWWQH